MNNNPEFGNNQQSQILNNLNSIPLQNNNNINNQFNMASQNNPANQGFNLEPQSMPTFDNNQNINQVSPATNENNNRFIMQNEPAQTQNIENSINQAVTPENNISFALGTTANTTYADAIKKETAPMTNRNPFEEQKNNDENNLFIHSNTNYNETSLNDLNVDGTYNQMMKQDYTSDPKVMENIEKTKKNTIPITKELKTFFLIAIVLFIFIIIMPYIFDAFRNVNLN